MTNGELTFNLDKIKDDSVDVLSSTITTTCNPYPYTWTMNIDDFYSKKKAELPERVIFSDPATILIWKNGDKTVVKTSKGDKYNPLYGFLMAYFKYTSGLNSSKRDKYFKKIMEENDGKFI